MAEPTQDTKAKKRVSIPILGLFSVLLSFASLAAVLSYDIWADRWLAVRGIVDVSSRPHQHEEMGAFTSQALNLESRLQSLEHILPSLQTEQQTSTLSHEQFLDTLEHLQRTLSEQQSTAEARQQALQDLQASYDSLRLHLFDNPQTLSVITVMINDRRNLGLPLGRSVDLLSEAGLVEIADSLRIFTDEAIPTNEELLRNYESLRPDIALALGGSISNPNNFVDGLKSYFASLVRVRKLGESDTATGFETISQAVEARDFGAVYELAKNLDLGSKEFTGWLSRLDLRVRADTSMLALHDELSSRMLQQLGESQ